MISEQQKFGNNFSRPFAPVFSALVITSLLGFGDANADWREDIGVFKIGIVSGSDITATMNRVEPFRKAIETALKIDVEILPARDFPTIIDAQIEGRLEYAIFSAGAYATAFQLCECIEPLVLPTASDQTREFRAAIISSESGPNSPSEIQVDKFGITNPNTIGSTSFALHTLKLGGSDFSGENSISVFEKADGLTKEFLDGRLNAILGWSSFTGDAGTGYSRGTLKRIAELTDGKTTGYRVIWKSLPIPHGPHAVLKKLPSEVKKTLRNTLLAMFSKNPAAYDSVEQYFSGGFATAKHSQYVPMIKFVETIGNRVSE